MLHLFPNPSGVSMNCCSTSVYLRILRHPSCSLKSSYSYLIFPAELRSPYSILSYSNIICALDYILFDSILPEQSVCHLVVVWPSLHPGFHHHSSESCASCFPSSSAPSPREHWGERWTLALHQQRVLWGRLYFHRLTLHAWKHPEGEEESWSFHIFVL